MDELPLCQKYALTLNESAIYFNIGVNKLREMTDTVAIDCVLKIGNKRLIKRRPFEAYLDTAYSI